METNKIEFHDNLKELAELFDLRATTFYDDAHVDTNGSVYVCKKCGNHAYSNEAWYQCQNQYIPQKVVCGNFPKCRNRWVLIIAPTTVLEGLQ